MFHRPDVEEVGLMACAGWLGAWFIFSFRDSGSVLLNAVEERSVCVCVCVSLSSTDFMPKHHAMNALYFIFNFHFDHFWVMEMPGDTESVYFVLSIITHFPI